MEFNLQNVIFIRLEKQDEIPYELLLLADPSKEVVDSYLKKSVVFIAKLNEETIGVVVLFSLDNNDVEIKNIAVKPQFQGKGLGSYLINSVLKNLEVKNYRNIFIGTANSSISQLYLYQKLGFKIVEIWKNFFVDNYVEPIYENGIQAKHMIRLKKEI